MSRRRYADVGFGSYVSLVSFGSVMRELIDTSTAKSFHHGAVTVSAQGTAATKMITTAGDHAEGNEASRTVIQNL